MGTNEKRDFNAKAATWDEEPRRVQLARDITAAILLEIPLSPFMKALDYGCGSGLVTLGIQPYVQSIVGADSSHGMLDVLTRKIREQGLSNVSTRLIDLTSMDGFDENFDLIVSSMTMHHVHNPKILISAFVKVLNPGGWLAIADLEAEDGSFHDDLTGVLHHGFEQKYLQEILTENGCVDVRIVRAAVIRKCLADGRERIYPVLLAVGRKKP
ncbi:MAG: class I SAM-dependent methyltransferase [Deltaproteobacteria bacterium]